MTEPKQQERCHGTGQIITRRDDSRGPEFNMAPDSTACTSLYRCPGCPDCTPAQLVAEYKRRSPFDGLLSEEALEEAIPRFERMGAAWISVLVEPEWGGSYEDLAKARGLTDLPLLAKGRSVFPARALAAGANAVLVYGRPIEGAESWVECHTETELREAIEAGASVVVANNRDLKTGEIDRGIAESLARLVPSDVTFVAASGYGSTDEAPERADLVLIGTALAQPVEQQERWTIWVCDGCGSMSDENGLDRWGQCIVRHGMPTPGCSKPARVIEVVPASSLTASQRQIEELRAENETLKERDGILDAIEHDYGKRVAAETKIEELTRERDALLDELQHVAIQHGAICKSDHHAGTCRGAVRLSERAQKVLASLSVEPRGPEPPAWDSPCVLCGEGRWVLGEIWLNRWMHADCIDAASAAEAERDTLREALEPFARAGAQWESLDETMIGLDRTLIYEEPPISVADLLRARFLLSTPPDKEEG